MTLRFTKLSFGFLFETLSLGALVAATTLAKVKESVIVSWWLIMCPEEGLGAETCFL